jgi:hypothetical protein
MAITQDYTYLWSACLSSKGEDRWNYNLINLQKAIKYLHFLVIHVDITLIWVGSCMSILKCAAIFAENKQSYRSNANGLVPFSRMPTRD